MELECFIVNADFKKRILKKAKELTNLKNQTDQDLKTSSNILIFPSS